ncbi:hypothetical protein Deipr_0594 [Deinococcus proteolyticus MRP]|uniref:Lipoprotein n=1 Tax=Deinococcus proteolyticus (strain ATCC 35074 / DSM 20540 / JCM 6276 / NBRC 101906 / NCIMB 13154 / VKM Ac-1939 / CCM 2703 / MRP) TaxID=693977 RepID=F0RKY3_DEIPM|nr:MULTISPECIES: hypothetical protein [Deinococcus]ADY25756.1 hypothetical protein Deipr_0594 [Deinococcus proteolyticus MRP]MCY1701880.1 hypothetical protein [Deinococcus sp. SL84]
MTHFPERSSRTASAPLALGLSLCLLTGCTGTVERGAAVNLALLTGGGSALQRVQLPAASSDMPRPAAVLGDPVAVEAGVDLHPLPAGRSFVLTRRPAAEERSAALAPLNTFQAPPFPACWQASAVSPGAERYFAVSQCEGGPQNAALYNSRGELQWWAALPLAAPPLDAADMPPLRVAVAGEVGVVARPLLGGGSEMLRVAVRSPGDKQAETSVPQRTVAVRDLATLSVAGRATVYAATDGGVFPLTTAGVPDANPLPAFGPGRYDRLWASEEMVGSSPILAAWRSESAQTGRQPLRVWDGVSTAEGSAQTADLFADLRDVALADGYLYLLTRDSLLRYDAVLGVRQGNWRLENLGLRLNDARALVRTFAAE